MPKVHVEKILESLAAALNAMPDVFSTPQWGGRAYKLPRPGSRGTKKPILLTHVSIGKEREAVRLGFRLEPMRAKAVIKQHAFIKPSHWGNLKNSGWIEMALTTNAQCQVVIGLLKESRSLHPVSEAAVARVESKSGRKGTRGRAAVSEDDGVTKRLDAVLRRKREEGWTPQDDDFDD